MSNKVGVIIPLYNKSRYIARALDSVFAQLYQDYEIIVVDDGSTDDGPEVVKEYRDKRLRLVHQANAGPGAARNRGVWESNAPFLSFLDADDEWMPEFLQESVSKLKSNPDCDLTASAYFLGKQRTDVSSILFKRYGIAEGPWKVREDMSAEELRGAHYIFNSWAILCKRTVVERYGGFRSKDHCSYGEDTYLWLQVMFNHQAYMILQPLVWYHSEVSDLGPGRRTERPLQTFLRDPDQIRMSCPQEYLGLLELFLAGFALATAHDCAAGNGSADKLRYLLNAFPLMKEFKWEYTKLRLKMMAPELIPFVRCVKSGCFNIHDFCVREIHNRIWNLR